MKRYQIIVALALAGLIVSCGKEEEKIKNPAKYITDKDKLDMLYSMKDLDGKGRLYELDYTVDYKLDQVLKSNITDTENLFKYVAYLLYDELPGQKNSVSIDPGCSVFAVPESGSKNYIMGRNYDYRHFNSDKTSYVPTSAILVRTAPKGGKKSISMVDGLNMGFGQGFFSNGTQDISLLMGLPYAALDGINEDGFAIGVLALSEKQTNQQTGKPRIGTTVAIRMLLDKASTVKEAIEMLKNYDMDMRGSGRSNYHYFMADATGDYAIVEYTLDGKSDEPSVMEIGRAHV